MAKGEINLLGLDREQLETLFADIGERSFRASQVLKWIHQHRMRDFDGMTNLSKALRVHLSRTAVVRPPEVVERRVSRDGTRKWLLRVDSSNCIETVFIPEEGRGTLCVSSQVGCALNCSFCATAQQGFSRNLTAAEIVGQLWLVHQELHNTSKGERPVTNVVLMGMGEPLLNLDNVVAAMNLMLDDNAYGLARRRITLSTAGVVPQLDRLRERCPVSLAVSLHSPDDVTRDHLVPLNRKYPISTLLAACRRYAARDPKHKVTFEYALLEGINDRPEHAYRLSRLLRNLPAKINLIPFNPFPNARYRASAHDTVERFRKILLDEGLMTITRKTRGADIEAACGQLSGRVQPRAGRLGNPGAPAEAGFPIATPGRPLRPASESSRLAGDSCQER